MFYSSNSLPWVTFHIKTYLCIFHQFITNIFQYSPNFVMQHFCCHWVCGAQSFKLFHHITKSNNYCPVFEIYVVCHTKSAIDTYQSRIFLLWVYHSKVILPLLMSSSSFTMFATSSSEMGGSASSSSLSK